LRGEISPAQTAYQTGLQQIETLLNQAAYFHRDLGYLYANEVDFGRAEIEVARLRHEAANLEGFISEMRGNMPAAESAYQEAFRLAQTSQYFYGEANTHNNLGRIAGWRRDLAAAEAHLGAAIEFFSQHRAAE
jgi:Flp pilus assembly protein TadD